MLCNSPAEEISTKHVWWVGRQPTFVNNPAVELYCNRAADNLTEEAGRIFAFALAYGSVFHVVYISVCAGRWMVG